MTTKQKVNIINLDNIRVQQKDWEIGREQVKERMGALIIYI